MSTLTIRLTDDQASLLDTFKRCNDIATSSKALLFALEDYSRIKQQLHDVQRDHARLAYKVEQQQAVIDGARDSAKLLLEQVGQVDWV